MRPEKDNESPLPGTRSYAPDTLHVFTPILRVAEADPTFERVKICGSERINGEMVRPTSISVIAITFGLLLAPQAEAKSKKARVRAHKARAFSLFEKGDYGGGIEEMEQAYALIPHPGFLLNIAVAYDRWNGHCAESLEAFERFFLECDRCNLLAGARKKHRKVEAACRVPVRIESTPPGAHVAVDGTVRGQTPYETRLLPGTYGIVLDLSGYERRTETLRVAKGEPQTLPLSLKKQTAPPRPPPPLVAVTEPPSSGPSPATWVAFGAGAVGLATGATFTVLTMQKLDAEEEARATPLPKAEIESLQQQARRNAIVAHVGYGVAVAGVATGVILLLVTGDDEPKEVTALPAFGPKGVGVVGRF